MVYNDLSEGEPLGNSGTARSEGLHYVQEESTENALKIRLAVEPVLDQIEMFLSGQEYSVSESGQMIKVNTANALANPRGVRALMNTISMICNSQVVQGNLTKEEIGQLMSMLHKSLSSTLAWHTHRYGISRSEKQMILDNILFMVKPFLSRTKDNKERDSYGQRTIQTAANTYAAPRSRGVFK